MDGEKPRVLVVGRGPRRAVDLAAATGPNGFEFQESDPAAAAKALGRSDIDIVLLDYPLLDDEALSICRSVRAASGVPVVISSFSSTEADIVRGYDAGADDYLVMPMRPVELSARLRAVLRRAGDRERQQAPRAVIQAGDLEIRLDEHRVYRDGAEIDLSPIEFRLLAALAREVGRAVSHSKLLSSVWGPEYVDCRNYLRLYIRYLRNKIEHDPKSPELILNEWGVGYRFEPNPA